MLSKRKYTESKINAKNTTPQLQQMGITAIMHILGPIKWQKKYPKQPRNNIPSLPFQQSEDHS